MSAFKVENGIPVPAYKRQSIYPWAEMEVGDSFLIPGAKTSASVASAISYRKNRYGEQHVCRAVDGGLRVWRTA